MWKNCCPLIPNIETAMLRTSRLQVAVVASVAVLAACGSDSGVAPGATPATTLEQVFKEMTVPGLSAVASVGGGVSAPLGGGFAIPTGCSFAAASQSFVCPSVTANGFTVTQSYTLLNAAGGSLSQFDASVVAAVRVRSSLAGTTTVNGSTQTMNSERVQTLSGLQTATHTLNGTMTTATQRAGAVGGGGPSSFTSNSTTSVANLVLPAAGSATKYPKSGTVTIDMRISNGTTPAFDLRFVMLYDGSSKVRVTTSRDGDVTSTCTVDLASSAPICA